MFNKLITFSIGALFATHAMAQDTNTVQSNNKKEHYTVTISMETRTGDKVSNFRNNNITCEDGAVCGAQLDIEGYLPAVTPSYNADGSRNDLVEPGSIKMGDYVYFDFTQPSKVSFRYSSEKLNHPSEELRAFGSHSYDGNNVNGVASLGNLDKQPLVIKIDAPVPKVTLNLPDSLFGGGEKIGDLNAKTDNILTITVRKLAW